MSENNRRNSIGDRLLNRIASGADHHLPSSACLGCGDVLDAATVMDGTDMNPYPGAISLCFRCGHIQAFADDLTFRPLTDEEIVEIAGDPELVFGATIIGPWRELYEKRDTLTPDEIRKRLDIMLKAMLKAERAKEK